MTSQAHSCDEGLPLAKAVDQHGVMTTLTGQQIADENLVGWVSLAGGLQTRILTPDFTTGLGLVNSIAAAAEEQDHHPDLDLRYGHVDIRTSSHDVRGLSTRDVRLARTITDLAATAGLTLDPAGLSRFDLALDTPERSKIIPFWAAVLRMDDQASAGLDDEIRDPSDAHPLIWFQDSGSEEPRQRWHLDVWVDPSDVQPRIDAAVAAGGTLVDAEQAPSFWVLADPDGNKICLCTWQERD